MKLECPQCGGNLDLQPRSLQLICPFCNTPLAFEKELFLETYKVEPTIEEEPARVLIQQYLCNKGRDDAIIRKEFLYLPFYRFLRDRNGIFTESVFSALQSPPFSLFSIPSGTMTALEKNMIIPFRKPEKNLSDVLQRLKAEKAKLVEEMLLVYVPFWKITILSGDVVWLDAVQGNIVDSNVQTRSKQTSKLRKIAFSGFLALLLLEGIFISPIVAKLLVQGGTAIGFFFFLKKRFRNEN